MSTTTTMLLQGASKTMNAGVNYLAEHQLPNGEFASYISGDLELQSWTAPDSINFITALIGNALLPLKERDDVALMLKKMVPFFQYQSMRGGIWQFHTKWHRYFPIFPPDIDDTVIISRLLQQLQVPFLDNTKILLANKRKDGVFYTWFTLHPTFLKFPKIYWLSIARELKHPIGSLGKWIYNPQGRNDVDVIVNANIIYYLGYTEVTQPSAALIINTIKNNKEINSDKWYTNLIVYYYFIARLFSIPGCSLMPVKALLLNKIVHIIDKQAESLSDLQNAMALLSLLHLSYEAELIDALAQRLIEKQTIAGNWKRYSLFCGGPGNDVFWGSEEATTAFCVEALHLYHLHLQNTL